MKELLRATYWNGASTVIKALGLILLAHLIAVHVGPTGMGIFGQFSSVVTILFVFAGGGFGHGITSTIGKNSEDRTEIVRFLRAGAALTIAFSLASLLLSWILAEPLAKLIFGKEEFAWAIRAAGLAQVFMGIYNLVLPVYNGFRRVDSLFLHILIGIPLGVGLSSLALSHYHLDGALLTAITYNVGLWIGLLLVSLFQFPLPFKALIPRWDKAKNNELLRYSAMALTTALLSPITYLVLRGHIERQLGWEAVGYWQATLRISDAYIMFVVMVLTSHYLPHLARAATGKEIRQQTGQFLRFLLPLSCAAATGIYLLREPLVHLLFSPAFAPATNFVGMQVVIDILRCSAWAFSYLYLARGHRNYYIVSEAIYALGVVLLAQPMVETYGLQGAYFATLAATTVYLVFSLISFLRLTAKNE